MISAQLAIWFFVAVGLAALAWLVYTNSRIDKIKENLEDAIFDIRDLENDVNYWRSLTELKISNLSNEVCGRDKKSEKDESISLKMKEFGESIAEGLEKGITGESISEDREKLMRKMIRDEFDSIDARYYAWKWLFDNRLKRDRNELIRQALEEEKNKVGLGSVDDIRARWDEHIRKWEEHHPEEVKDEHASIGE